MHVFLSYVSENRPKVRTLSSALEAAGVRTWTDWKDISPGQRWKPAIRAAIEDAHTCVLCLSREALARPSSYMRRQEVKIAIRHLRRLPRERQWLLVLILDDSFDDDEVPPLRIRPGETLRDLQHVRLGRTWDDGVERALRVLRRNQAMGFAWPDPRPFFSPWRSLRAIAATLACMALVSLGYLAFLHWRQPVSVEWIHLTSAEEQRVCELPDGSSVTLARGTDISVHMTDSARDLILERGEALFTVSHRVNTPFTVHARNGSVSALSTQFDVRLDSRRVVILVTEGAVQVGPRRAKDADPGASSSMPTGEGVKWSPVKVSSGEEMIYSASEVSAPGPADVQARIGWTKGRLVYSTPRLMRDVVDDVTRYTGRQIEIDERAATLPYAGMIQEEALGQWLENLPFMYPLVEVVPRGSKIEIRYRRGTSEAHPVSHGADTR